MEISASMKLLEKTVEIDGVMRDVYGVAVMRSNPQWQGLGRMMLRWAEEKARRDGKFCCLGFAIPATYERFDKKAGWSNCGMYEGRVITASIPAAKVIVNEKW
jgi:GNAT superfamily N-acetyltransferase